MPNHVQSFRNLIIWQKSKQVCLLVYETTNHFPEYEKYGLTNQMRRAAVSIPSNIAEGFARQSPKEKQQFLNFTNGSCSELETQIDIAQELGFIKKGKYEEIINILIEVKKMMNSTMKKLKISPS